jgi:hypothetical protein
VIDGYLRQLERDLAARGVRGRSADRVLAEARDHLLELGDVERFGPSDRIAEEIAAQLATTRTIRSSYGAFAALALTGLAYLAFLALAGQPDLFGARHEAIGLAAVLGLVLGPQVALVSGCLAVLRAVRLRGRSQLSAEELDVIRARATVALGAGAVTVLAMAVWVVEYRQSTTLLVLPALAAVALAAEARAVRRAGQPEAIATGPAGDVFDDLGFRFDPWGFALVFAVLIGVLGFAGGWVAEGDPGSGVVRGGFEAIAVLGCFTVLGRRLALRR